MSINLREVSMEPRTKGKDTPDTRLTVAIAAFILMIGLFSSFALAQRLSIAPAASTAAQRSVDATALANARDRLLADMAPVIVAQQPRDAGPVFCSPFASLTACLADEFVVSQHLSTHPPV